MSAGAPDIASLLASLGGGGAPPDAQGGPPSPGFQEPSPSQPQDDIPNLLQQALDLVTQAYQQETDPLDREAIGKVMSSLDALFAQEQKDKDAAMGGSSNLRLMRRNR